MSIKDYFTGGKSLGRAVVANVVGLALFTRLIETLISRGILPRFEIPGSFYELIIFVAVFTVVLSFDWVVWRCADNARYRITKLLGKLYAAKGVLFLLLVLSIWVYKAL